MKYLVTTTHNAWSICNGRGEVDKLVQQDGLGAITGVYELGRKFDVKHIHKTTWEEECR
jgi:hypothetical protein